MSPILLGILDQSGVAVAGGSYESIATVSVGSGGQSSIVFSSIPSTYKHLQIRGIMRSTSASTGGSWCKLTCNSTTSSTGYARHVLYGTGSSAAAEGRDSSSGTGFYSFYSAHTGDNGSFAGIVVDILDYASTSKYKTIRALDGFDSNGGGIIMLNSELFLDTAAISSITIEQPSYTIGQYSTLALYGIKD